MACSGPGSPGPGAKIEARSAARSLGDNSSKKSSLTVPLKAGSERCGRWTARLTTTNSASTATFLCSPTSTRRRRIAHGPRFLGGPSPAGQKTDAPESPAGTNLTSEVSGMVNGMRVRAAPVHRWSSKPRKFPDAPGKIPKLAGHSAGELL